MTSVAGFGRFVSFSAATAQWMVLRVDRWCKWRLLGPQLYAVGVASIPVIAITGAFIGMVLALEGFAEFESLGQEGRLGGIINISVTKQIGPVLAAVMVAGRVGGSLAAAAWGLARGIQILRVHDVAETAQAARVLRAIMGEAEETAAKN